MSHGRICGGIACGGDGFFRCSGQPLLEMELDGRVPAGGHKRLDKRLLSVCSQQGRRQPGGFEAVDKMPGFAEIGGPEHIVSRRAGSVVGENGGRRMDLEKCRITAAPRGDDADQRRQHEPEIVRRGGHPTQERLPDRVCLFLVESLEFHPDIKPAAGTEGDDLAPVGVEQVLVVEAGKSGDQPSKGGIGGGADRGGNHAEGRGQLARAECQPGDDAETAATAVLQCPEQVGIGAGIRNPHRPVGGDDFRFQQRRGGRCRSSSNSCRTRRPGSARPPRPCRSRRPAHSGRPCGDGVVGVHPDRTRAHRGGRMSPAAASCSPVPRTASCSVILFIARVQTSSESGAFEVPR